MNKKECNPCKKTSIGGQALMEGIMMRGPKRTVLAVRNPEGEIVVEDVKPSKISGKKITKIPIIRGVVNFVDSMVTGYKCLMRSADISGMTDLEEEEERKKREAEGREKKDDSLLIGIIMVVGSVLGVLLAIALFMWLPTCVFNLINAAATPSVAVTWSNIFNGFESGSLDLYKALIEGVMKMALFVGYVAIVSLEKDIKRVFQYHGAEHKTIFCYEAGLPLTVENCRKQSRFHPRCGTSFMFLMIAVGILISTVIVIFAPSVTKITWLWVLIKILLIPLFCGVGYELIKFCGRHDNLLTRIIAAPGLWVQRLTTKEPDDSMLECAIKSIEAVIPENAEDDKW